MTAMIVTTLLCFAVLMGIAFFIVRDIMTNLDRMVMECNRMKDGDFRLNSNYEPRGDELGQMDAAMQDMRKTLNKLMRHVSESAEQLRISVVPPDRCMNRAGPSWSRVPTRAALKCPR